MARRHHAIAMKPDRQPPPAAACHHTSSAHCASPEDAEKGPHGHQDSADRAEERYRRRLLRCGGGGGGGPCVFCKLSLPCAASPSSGVVGSSVGQPASAAGRSACRSVGRSVGLSLGQTFLSPPSSMPSLSGPQMAPTKGNVFRAPGPYQEGEGGRVARPSRSRSLSRCCCARDSKIEQQLNKRLIGQRATCRKPISARLEWNGKCMGESAHGNDEAISDSCARCLSCPALSCPVPSHSRPVPSIGWW